MSTPSWSRRAFWFVVAGGLSMCAWLAWPGAAPEATPALASPPGDGTRAVVTSPAAAEGSPRQTADAGATAAMPAPDAATTWHLRGRVHDELLQSVAEFRLTIAPATASQEAASGLPSIPCHRLDGSFAVHVATAPPWRLFVAARGFLPAWSDVAAADPPHAVDAGAIRLLRPALIHGTTVAPNGEGIEGIRLVCRALATNRPPVHALSGPGGAYQLTPANPGDYAVSVDGEDAADTVHCRTGAPTLHTVRVPPATTVVCTVSNAGQPIAGAPVRLALPFVVRSALSDANGVATFVCVPRGDHRLDVAHPGFGARVVAADTRDRTRTTFAVSIELEPLPR